MDAPGWVGRTLMPISDVAAFPPPADTLYSVKVAAVNSMKVRVGIARCTYYQIFVTTYQFLVTHRL